MSNSQNRTCVVCMKQYKYCASCDKNEPLWKNCFDTENCKNIYDAVVNYNSGSITKQQFKEKISKCDLSGKNNFKKSILDVINKNYFTKRRRTAKQSLEDNNTNLVDNEVI